MVHTGYSGTPLSKKPGIKDGLSCYFQNHPEHYFELLGELPKIEITNGLNMKA